MAGQVWSSLAHAVVGTFQGLVQTGTGPSDAIQPPTLDHGAFPGAFPGAFADPIPTDGVPQIPYYSSSVQERFPAELFTAVARTPSPVFKGADICYEYDQEKHLARKEARLKTGGLRTDLPRGWPKSLHGPLVWTTSDYQDESLFKYPLSDSDRAEIIAALKHFKGLGKKEKDIDQSSFPLPNLAKKLSVIRTDLYQGRGFATLRGLDIDALNPDDLTTVYLGLTSYIAEKRGKQNRQGTMMINVVNNSEEADRENAKLEMPFHTDLCCDTLSMLTVSCGLEGGSGVLASAWTVYNELVETRPDLIHVLAEPNWPFDTHGRTPPYYLRALMYLKDGKLVTNFSRRLLVGHPSNGMRTQGIPGLTEAQAEALDTLHEIGRKHELKQPTVKGDIRFLNNLALMHRRDTFIDDAENRRHLLRLWLHNPEDCWNLPTDLQLAWERIFNDDTRKEDWHFVKFSPAGERYMEPVWETPAPEPHPGAPLPPPLPTTACD